MFCLYKCDIQEDYDGDGLINAEDDDDDGDGILDGDEVNTKFKYLIQG